MGVAWVGFALGLDHLHVYGYTTINCPRERKKLSPGFAGNVVNIEGRHKLIVTVRPF